MLPSIANDSLRSLVGDWSGLETIAPSTWGPGGEAVVRASFRSALDGKVLLHDYRAERDGKPWMNAHAVFAFDAPTDTCSLFWFDSLGFVPAQPAAGSCNGETFEFIRTSSRGQTRHSFALRGRDRYFTKLESSFNGGVVWVLVAEGIHTRIGRSPGV
jgi:hypothetical protein